MAWGIGGFRGREKPNIKQNIKKKSVKQSEKAAKLEKKSDIFFFIENGLKCNRNPMKHF